MKKTYIITGANGFLGNNIIRILEKQINEGDEIRALVLPEDKLKSLDGLNCKIYKGDVTNIDSLKDIFSNIEADKVYVIHCAAIVYIKSKYNQKVYDVNVGGTKNIIKKVEELNKSANTNLLNNEVRGGNENNSVNQSESYAKLVYINSVHALPERPKNEVITEITDFNPDKVNGEYAKTKAEIAKYVLEKANNEGLDVCIIQPSGIIGPYDFGNSHLTQMILDFANGRLTACVKGGYDFVDVRDVANGVINACEKGRKGECYILSNDYIEVRDLLDIISEIQGRKKIKTVLPMWFAKLTAPLSETYYKIMKEPPLYTKYSLYVLTSNGHFSNEKAKKELGYTTRDIKDTIKDTVEWLKESGRIKNK